MGFKTLLVTIAALVQVPVAKSPPPLGADEVVARVQKYYETTTKLQASFRQNYTNVTFGRKSTSDGEVYVMKPGKMRWDYKKPEKKHFISDGSTLWVYEVEAKQAFKQSIEDQVLPVAITFLYGKGDLAGDFKAQLDPGSGYGGRDDYVLKLTPRQPTAQYKHLWLVVDSTDFHVKKSVILESSDNVNEIMFTKIKLNDQAKHVTNDLFKFKVPKGVKVIEPKPEGDAAGK